MFSYEVYSEEEANKLRYSILKDGEYNAVIDKAELKISSNGNAMFEMTLSVYDENKRANTVKDYLVFSPKMTWKVIHCCSSAGVLEQFEAKRLVPQLLVGRNVRVAVGLQVGNLISDEKLNGKPKGSLYPDKNIITDYLPRLGAQSKTNAAEPFNDDLPF